MPITGLVQGVPLWMILLSLWELPWKGVAMWRAAQNKHLIWFIVFLLVHLFAIPEIVYLLFFSKGAKGAKGFAKVEKSEKKSGKK